MSKKFTKKANPDLEDRVNNEKWPDRSPLWSTLTPGQKWSRIKSYNSARRARGKPPIPNPYQRDEQGKYKGKEHVNPDGSLSLTPKPPSFVPGLNKSIKSNAFFKRLLDSGYTSTTIKPVIDKYSSELDKVIENAPGINWEALEGDELDIIDDQQLIDALNDYEANNPFISGGKRKEVTGGTKDSDPKTRRVGQEDQVEAPSTEQANITPISDEMVGSIPGAAAEMEVDLAAAVGSGGPSGINNMPATTNIFIDRPISVAGGYTIEFSKVHHVLSYGFSNEIKLLRAQAGTAPNIVPALYGITTSLLNIPWDRLFYYLNPGEQFSLAKGARATRARVKIVQQKVRVAFETNTTTNALATLNQNVFGEKVIGLNTNQDVRIGTVHIASVSPAPENMKPATIRFPTAADMNAIDTRMYGQPQSAGAAFTTTVPAQPFEIPIHYNKYAASLNTAAGAAAPNPQVKSVGWPDLSKHAIKYDMAAMAHKTIVDETYVFKDAPISGQLPYVEYMTGAINGVDYTNCVFNDHDVGKEFNKSSIGSISNYVTSNPSETQTALTTNMSNYDAKVTVTNFRTMIPLEKVQWTKNIDTNRNTGNYVQPSIHVGVSKVPRFTPEGDATLLSPDSWTDVQAYYIVTAELQVFVPYEHSSTHYGEWHKHISNIDMATNEFAVPDIPIRMGHYPTTTGL